jgi:hypothetical protein
VRFLRGNFTGGTAYNASDFDGDGNPDVFFWAVASGGSSPSNLWYLPGDGRGGFGDAVSLPRLGQAANSGAIGDVDGDGCSDWVNGANDDGQRGSLWLVRGDCNGGVIESRLLVDHERHVQGRFYGDGATRLWDADYDGDLDIVASVNSDQGGPAALFFWTNDGTGSFGAAPAVTLVPMWNAPSTGFVVPLRE